MPSRIVIGKAWAFDSFFQQSCPFQFFFVLDDVAQGEVTDGNLSGSLCGKNSGPAAKHEDVEKGVSSQTVSSMDTP